MSPHAEYFVAENERAVEVQAAFSNSNGFHDDGLDVSQLPGIPNSSHLQFTPEDELHDLVCVGFGPASLAIAVALHDSLDGIDSALDIPSLQSRQPRVTFLEKQHKFAWHAGMLLPGAKMQISFMKDMATLRNPRSEFTFINYLFQKDRLTEFINLNTFLPQRIEYEDYMRWCASWFNEVVRYNQEVVKVTPVKSSSGNGEISTFIVESRNVKTHKITTLRTRHVVIAAGGRPNIPKPFPSNHPRVVHSSQFCHISSKVLTDPQAPYKVAVVGNGQSAAEIFDYLHAHYANCETQLLIKGGALRPSDDSPLYVLVIQIATLTDLDSVNEIFNPERVDSTYARPAEIRRSTIREDKGTNYGVVRLNLLEHIYETLYTQRIRYGNTPEAEQHWPHRILPYRNTLKVEDSPVIKGGIRLHIQDQSLLYLSDDPNAKERLEVLDVDAVFVATGYRRDLHETLLQDARHLMPGGDLQDAKWQVQRDYRINFADKKVSEDAGVWLQGCNESTHGVSLLCPPPLPGAPTQFPQANNWLGS